MIGSYVTGDDITFWLLDLAADLYAAGMKREAQCLEKVIADLHRERIDTSELQSEINCLTAQLEALRPDDQTNVVKLHPKKVKR